MAKIENVPDKIYLLIGDCVEANQPQPDFMHLDEVRWCVEPDNGDDVEFIRADLADKLKADIVRLKAIIARSIRGMAHASKKGDMMWVVVQNMTSHGSTISCEICRDFGIDPHMTVKEFFC